jgi:ligand-binding SRPBCC domain-containing protein
MFVLERTQELPISVEKAWEFFSSPKNLQVITPSYLGFEIKTTLPERMYEGLFIGYTVKPLLGIPLEWVTEITHIKEHKFFVDEQRKGPYTIWHHEHHFEAIEGGVRMLDRVSYQLPLGFLGKMMQPILVEPKLKEIFNYRWNKVEELFGKFK